MPRGKEKLGRAAFEPRISRGRELPAPRAAAAGSAERRRGLLSAVARAAVGVDLCGLDDDPSLEHVGCNALAPASASVALCRLPRDVSRRGILGYPVPTEA
ncbi:hypothetical protein HPB47_000763, partial [Ixodes persulcatus]